MSASIISTAITRHIIPFSFNSDELSFEQICQKLCDTTPWNFDATDNTEHDTYNFLSHSIKFQTIDKQTDNTKNKIGCSFLYDKSFVLSLAYRPDKHSSWINFDIRKLGLFLFRTGIGFLWYEYDFPTPKISLDQFYIFSNKFKELNMLRRTENNIRLVHTVSFPLGELTSQLSAQKPVSEEINKYTLCTKSSHSTKHASEPPDQYWFPTDLLTFKITEKLSECSSYFNSVKATYEISTPKITQTASDLRMEFSVYQKFTMGHQIRALLSTFPGKITYLPERKDSMSHSGGFVPDKALLFNYMLITGSDSAQLADIAFHLTNGYAQTYLMNPDTIHNMYSPFQGALWYATPEGCGYYVNDNPINHSFFSGNISSKIKGDYFLLYILVLHQSYSLLHYAQLVEQTLSADPEDYLSHPEEHSARLDELQTRVNVFLLKSINAFVSHIHHQNLFYEYLQKQYRIHENIHSLTVGLDSLEDLQRFMNQKKIQEQADKEEQQRQESNDRLSTGLSFLSILAIFSAFADGLGFIDGLFSLQDGSESSFYLKIIILSIVVIICLSSLLYILKQKFKKNS